MKYRCIIFDLDGTILNTLDDLADSTNYALGQFGFSKRTTDEVRRFVGNGIGKLIERAVPENTDENTISEVLECFKKYYGEHCSDKTKPYEGIDKLIQFIKENDGLTAVVSNKADFAVQELCKQYFPGMFDFVVGEREGIRRKPSPDSVFEVLDKLSVKKEEALYVGDSDVDLETAKNAGIDCMAVEWGFRGRKFLIEKGADNIASKPQDIVNFLAEK